MKLLTQDIRERLLKNGRIRCDWSIDNPEPDLFPIVKLFTPDAGSTWLLTELDSDDPDIAIGRYDLGMGYPERGTVSIAELKTVRGKLSGTITVSSTAFLIVVVSRATSPSRTSVPTSRHHFPLSGTAFPLRDIDQSPNSNPFPRDCNGFPLNATSIPDNDNGFSLSDNAFPLNGNSFPDNGND